MKLISNTNTSNHNSVLSGLIKWSDCCLLCTSFLDKKGLALILPILKEKLQKSSYRVTIYSNGEARYTKPSVIKALSQVAGIEHKIVRKKGVRLHSKIYLFEKGNEFISVIGSANLTRNGLITNEELSVKLCGNIGSNEHNDILKYLNIVDRLSIDA